MESGADGEATGTGGAVTPSHVSIAWPWSLASTCISIGSWWSGTSEWAQVTVGLGRVQVLVGKYEVLCPAHARHDPDKVAGPFDSMSPQQLTYNCITLCSLVCTKYYGLTDPSRACLYYCGSLACHTKGLIRPWVQRAPGWPLLL